MHQIMEHYIRKHGPCVSYMLLLSTVWLWRSVTASTTHCANESMYVFNVGCVAHRCVVEKGEVARS